MIEVIIPLYNNGKTIDAALASVVRQSLFSESRVIVADDGSTDDSVVRVHKWTARYENIECHRNERNLGVLGNYERLLKLCRGEYVAPLEGDDVWLSGERLRTLRRYLSTTGLSVCFNKFLLRHGDRYSEGGTSLGLRYRVLSAFELIEANHPASFTNCFYRRVPFERVLAELKEAKSYDWMPNIILAARTGGIGFVPEVMSTYYVSPHGTWSSLDAAAQTAMIVRTLSELKRFIAPKYWSNIDYEISANSRAKNHGKSLCHNSIL